MHGSITEISERPRCNGLPAPPTEETVRAPLQGSVLARFLELRGRSIIKACGALWYTVPGRFLMSLPYHVMLNPDPVEVRNMLRDTKTFGARFPSLGWTGLESGLYVLRKRNYDIGSLHPKHRPRVRRALQCFDVRTAEKAEIVDQGWALNVSTMTRQGRYDSEFGDRRRWERFLEAAFRCPEITFPAAFHGRRMAAYMATCREEKWLHILHQMSRQEDLPNFPNHLLTFAVTKQATVDASLEAVCYGYVPLFEADGLHEYKLRFGYEMVPHSSAIQLHPALNVVLNQSAVRGLVRAARRIRHDNQQLETFETILEGARSSAPPGAPC
jgi:hypothetical protein